MKRFNKLHTKHLWINPSKCKACWNCINVCPRDVIGKVSFLWHKHIVIKNKDNCTGCKKCIEVCQESVFSETMPVTIENT